MLLAPVSPHNRNLQFTIIPTLVFHTLLLYRRRRISQSSCRITRRRTESLRDNIQSIIIHDRFQKLVFILILAPPSLPDGFELINAETNNQARDYHAVSTPEYHRANILEPKLFTTAVRAFRRLFARNSARRGGAIINPIRGSQQPSGNKEAVGGELYPKNSGVAGVLVTPAFYELRQPSDDSLFPPAGGPLATVPGFTVHRAARPAVHEGHATFLNASHLRFSRREKRFDVMGPRSSESYMAVLARSTLFRNRRIALGSRRRWYRSDRIGNRVH